MTTQILDTVLLLALPASGKSEVRKYLAHVSPATLKKDFHMGASAQLDDFPYVHLMRRIDDELAKLGKERIFFLAPDKPFQNPLDWGTLVALLNEDYRGLLARKASRAHLFDRLDGASIAAHAPARLRLLDGATRKSLAAALGTECREMADDLAKTQKVGRKDRTVVIEFARGGPQGSRMPLPGSFGYRYGLSLLSKEILARAAVLYIWVTPEESRRKNTARTNPNDPGSILHHGVPMEVMLNDYGCDDMDWLESQASKPGTIPIEAHGKTFAVPFARFDNRVDKTSFLRDDPAGWNPEIVRAVHNGLKGALGALNHRVHR